VFPGGRIEEEDRASGGAPLEHARRAAVREAAEEAGLVLRGPDLVPISRWITPPLTQPRYDTWFFACALAPEVEVRVDMGEITAHRWLAPSEIVEAHRGGTLRLAPPTFVTVSWLAGLHGAAEVVRRLAADEIPTFEPRIARAGETACILYFGDAGYADLDPERPGPRHRLWTHADGWHYERSGV
jgi:8-oxo-dGTP pyrophosphatase MutT (NUDIX family)